MKKLNAEKMNELKKERAGLRARIAGLRMERDYLKQIMHSPRSPFLVRYNATCAEIATISARMGEISKMLGETRTPYRKLYSDIYR